MPIESNKRLPILLLAASVTAAAVAARLYSSKKIGQNPLPQLTESLLETESLRQALLQLPDRSETALWHCAAYALQFITTSTKGLAWFATDTSPGSLSHTQQHPTTSAIATVVAEAVPSLLRLNYAVTFPDGGEVRGTRTLGDKRISGLMPTYPLTDTLQITLTENYTAQIETEMELLENPLTQQNRFKGTIVLRDNIGNVGRFQVIADGSVMGTITREGKIVGRAEGKVPSALRFRAYELANAEGPQP